jgi:hypothetical protein
MHACARADAVSIGSAEHDAYAGNVAVCLFSCSRARVSTLKHLSHLRDQRLNTCSNTRGVQT